MIRRKEKVFFDYLSMLCFTTENDVRKHRESILIFYTTGPGCSKADFNANLGLKVNQGFHLAL